MLTDKYRFHTLTSTAAINQKICEATPHILIFEFDYPDLADLRVLQQTKQRYPSLPIIMVTEQHSEELAVWALRSRVWDYFIKPVTAKDLRHSIDTLCKGLMDSGKHQHIDLLMPGQSIPIELRFRGPVLYRNATHNALSYINTHYHQKITLAEVAHLCQVSPSQLSRVFKQEYGLTFRDYLLCYRIEKARALLKNPNASVVEVAFAVGFNDHSYFSRMFRRHVGISPSNYRIKKRFLSVIPACLKAISVSN